MMESERFAVKKIIALPLFTLLLFTLALCMHSSVRADSDKVFELTAPLPMQQAYPNMMAALEKSRFYLFYEMNIGENLAFFAEKWGKEYNQNNLTAVRSIVFCNGWFLNKAGNQDAKILGLCPMHVSLIEKDGATTAFFVRPTVTYQDSPALDIIEKIEAEVIEMINNGMR